MRYSEWFFILLVLGIGFITLGAVLIVKGKGEEGWYFGSLSTRPDLRKYLEKKSLPAFVSLKVGGRISIIVGVALLILSGVLLYIGSR